MTSATLPVVLDRVTSSHPKRPSQVVPLLLALALLAASAVVAVLISGPMH